MDYIIDKNVTVHDGGYLSILSGCTLLPRRLEFRGNAIQYKPQKHSCPFPFTSLATGLQERPRMFSVKRYACVT
jgi:hypothetical protein